MNERKIIVLNDGNGVMKRIALTQDQINLLEWLSDNDWLCDEVNYQEEEEVETI
jgi:hypothetical protein